MSCIRLKPAGVFAFAALFVVTLAGPARGELVGDNPGTTLGTSNPVSDSLHPLVDAAVTLQDVVSFSPSEIESLSRIEFASVQASAFAAPLNVVAAPIQEWSAAIDDEPDSPGEGEEFAPMPEPSTWYAGLFTLAALLWPLSRRAWTRRQTPLEI